MIVVRAESRAGVDKQLIGVFSGAVLAAGRHLFSCGARDVPRAGGGDLHTGRWQLAWGVSSPANRGPPRAPAAACVPARVRMCKMCMQRWNEPAARLPHPSATHLICLCTVCTLLTSRLLLACSLDTSLDLASFVIQELGFVMISQISFRLPTSSLHLPQNLYKCHYK